MLVAMMGDLMAASTAFVMVDTMAAHLGDSKVGSKVASQVGQMVDLWAWKMAAKLVGMTGMMMAVSMEYQMVATMA